MRAVPLLLLLLIVIGIEPDARADRERPDPQPCCAVVRPVLTYELGAARPTEFERYTQLNLDSAYAELFYDCMSIHGVPRFDLSLAFARGASVAHRVRVTGPAAFRACIEKATWSRFSRAPSATVVRIRVGHPGLIERERRDAQKRTRRRGR